MNARPASVHASSRAALICAAVLLVLVLAAAVLLLMQTWSGPHVTPLARAVLRVGLIDGPLPLVVEAVAAVAVLATIAALLVAVGRARRARRTAERMGVARLGPDARPDSQPAPRLDPRAGPRVDPRPAPRAAPRPDPRPDRRLLVAAIATVAGGLLGGGLAWLLSAGNVFGVALDASTAAWAVAIFAAIGLALSTVWRSSAWRRLLAGVTIVTVAAAGYLGINADFGLDRTVADVAGVSTHAVISLPTVTPTATPSLIAVGPLWSTWHAPAGMPTAGVQSQVVIPNTLSGFPARPAGLYLPPAALTAEPPALPLVVMMMGQPGNPDPSFSAAVLDRFAAQHQGLAPIVLVPDQLGNPGVDPLCLDTARHGKAETYLMQDVVAWARTHLHVQQDAAHWTVAGYSNGGECALAFGVKYPQVFGNVLDISGEEYPGSDHPSATLAADFGGNVAAYDAAKPLNQLAGHHYADTVGIFTVGSDDGFYVRQQKAVVAATSAVGWKTTYFEVPNGGHVLGALNGGLQEGYTVLYPRLGLAAGG